MKKILLILIIALAVLFKTPTSSYAVTPPSFSPLYMAQAIPVNFSWQHSVRIYFIFLHNVKSASYMLTYTADGIPQGVTGSFDPMGMSLITKNILLGTCSTNSCVYHKNIHNLKLDVTFTYKNNHVDTKSYMIPTN